MSNPTQHISCDRLTGLAAILAAKRAQVEANTVAQREHHRQACLSALLAGAGAGQAWADEEIKPGARVKEAGNGHND